MGALAARLAALPTRALAQTRRVIDAGLQSDYDAALRFEAEVQRELGRGNDYREGVAAFVARRPAVFGDR